MSLLSLTWRDISRFLELFFSRQRLVLTTTPSKDEERAKYSEIASVLASSIPSSQQPWGWRLQVYSMGNGNKREAWW